MLTLFLGIPCYARRVHIVYLPDIKSGSIQTEVPVEGDIDDDTRILNVVFLEDIGNVNMQVRDRYGYAIYSETVETATENDISVELAGIIVGDYQIVIIKENKAGGYVGNFELY